MCMCFVAGNDDPAFITDTKTGKIAKDPKTGKDIPSNVTVTDMVTGKKILKADAKAGHIYQKRWPNALLVSSLLKCRSSSCHAVLGLVSCPVSCNAVLCLVSCHAVLGPVSCHAVLCLVSCHAVRFGVNLCVGILSHVQEQSGLIVHDPENIIITTKEAEAKLDKEDICLLPDEDGAAIRVSSVNYTVLDNPCW